MKDEKVEKADILDDVKKVERFKKVQVLAEAIGEIKTYAKEVLVLKEKTDLLLEEIGISKEDAKRVVDYVNSLVKLTDSDKKEIREEVKEVKKGKEEKVEKKMDKNPFPFNAYNVSLGGAQNSTMTANTLNGVGGITGVVGMNTVALGNSGYSINI